MTKNTSRSSSFQICFSTFMESYNSETRTLYFVSYRTISGMYRYTPAVYVGLPESNYAHLSIPLITTEPPCSSTQKQKVKATSSIN